MIFPAAFPLLLGLFLLSLAILVVVVELRILGYAYQRSACSRLPRKRSVSARDRRVNALGRGEVTLTHNQRALPVFWKRPFEVVVVVA